MMSDAIHVELLSDTTFSAGTGMAGEVDVEVAHDRDGCPYLPGRTLKGLLREAWLAMAPAFADQRQVACEVLGVEWDLAPRSTGRLEIRDGCLSAGLRRWVRFAVGRQDGPVAPEDVLRAFTDIRRQTARDRITGGPADGSLRASRVALRGLVFEAPILARDFAAPHWRLLSRLCLAVRHAGLGRNRGRGHVRLGLYRDGTEITREAAALEEI